MTEVSETPTACDLHAATASLAYGPSTLDRLSVCLSAASLLPSSAASAAAEPTPSSALMSSSSSLVPAANNASVQHGGGQYVGELQLIKKKIHCHVAPH